MYAFYYGGFFSYVSNFVVCRTNKISKFSYLHSAAMQRGLQFICPIYVHMYGVCVHTYVCIYVDYLNNNLINSGCKQCVNSCSLT